MAIEGISRLAPFAFLIALYSKAPARHPAELDQIVLALLQAMLQFGSQIRSNYSKRWQAHG
jgi:hypothetical protein